MGVSERARREKQRLRVLQAGKLAKKQKELKKDVENTKITIQKNKCIYCGFEAFYEYTRCPLCGAEKNE
jgi:rubrerythrin